MVQRRNCIILLTCCLFLFLSVLNQTSNACSSASSSSSSSWNRGLDLQQVACPICGMVIEDEKNYQSFRGNQRVYACTMAGDLEQLQTQPKEFLMDYQPFDLLSNTKNNIYHHYLQHVTCPVCGKKEISYSVSWGPKRNQKLFACSKEHAKLLFDHPEKYLVQNQTQPKHEFCRSKSVMFNGFQTTFHQTCVLFLFKSWVLNTEWKYFFAFLGVMLMAILLEYWNTKMEQWEENLVEMFRQQSHPSTTYTFWTEKSSVSKSLPCWCRCFMAFMYMIQITLAYFIMLIVMIYDTGLFLAVVIGLGIGYFIFNDPSKSGTSNPDPCCSS